MHSISAFARASTEAWHSAETSGGVTSASHWPWQVMSAMASALHLAVALASQPPEAGVYSQLPSQLPLQVPPASRRHSPWQLPMHCPAQLVMKPSASVSQAPPAHTEHSPWQVPEQLPEHSAATES